ncbi:GntR family transcriptional regulator [Ramlibacter sp. AW1]|uniref:GntR family transcriptional regulator n=1 Tax=Ramlibacter aurantiacus TaxID=2801330 RepID=A0A936ZPJ6_9BURK|nr:GntR family transcriptional regulator [Ramlibacter aurantiacus]MBL0421083.1 GntR family transcriptional regulator [Ramlibacter aurantiacus]
MSPSQDFVVPFAPAKDAPRPSGSVSDYVLHEIARRIVDGIYRPGQRIVEADVTRDLGVSRSSVREAFRRLENNRFIRIEPNRGATVAAPQRADIVAQFRIREVIAGLGARMAAERIDLPGHRELARGLLQDIDAQLKAGTPERHRTENGRFHRTINDMSGIPEVGELLDQFNFPILHTIYFRDLAVEAWRENLSDHLDIGRAVLHGDPVAAEHFARRHMHRSVDIAIEIAERLMKEEQATRFG